MQLPSWREISLQVTEVSTWLRLPRAGQLDKRLTFDNTISAANLADFRTKDAGQFHWAAKLRS